MRIADSMAAAERERRAKKRVAIEGFFAQTKAAKTTGSGRKETTRTPGG
jgi:hypothetical protein